MTSTMQDNVTIDILENSTTVSGKLTETLEELNKRYADALVPVAYWMGLLAVLGIFGNLLVIIVFSVGPEYKHSNFKVFVISLGIIDLLTCVTLMPAEIFKTRHYFSFSDATPCKVKCFFNLFGQNASNFVLLVICVDRYRKVCKPLSVQIWPELASRIITVVMVVSVVLSLPAPILCGISSANKTNIHGGNTTVFFCASEERYVHSPFRLVYKLGLTVSLLCVSCAFIVMYSLILKTIVSHWRSRRESLRIDSDEHLRDIENAAITPNADHMKHLPETPMVGGKIYSNGKAVLSSNTNGGFYSAKSKIQTVQGHRSQHALSIQKKTLQHRSGSDSSLRAYAVRRRSTALANSKLPYKTLIWVILTLVFIITYLINALLSFLTTELFQLSPTALLLFMFFFRIYFINNMINPIIYLCLDKRFKMSCSHIMNLLRRKWRLMRT